MKKTKQTEKLFLCSAASFSLMSLSILFMPLASELSEITNRISILVVGCVFWIGIVLGFVLLLMVNKERKECFVKSNKQNMQHNRGIRKSFLCPNFPATIFGFVMMMSLLGFIILLFTNLKYGYVPFILLFLIVFSLCMYCLFNGKNYRYIKEIREEKQNHE